LPGEFFSSGLAFTKTKRANGKGLARG